MLEVKLKRGIFGILILTLLIFGLFLISGCGQSCEEVNVPYEVEEEYQEEGYLDKEYTLSIESLIYTKKDKATGCGNPSMVAYQEVKLFNNNQLSGCWKVYPKAYRFGKDVESVETDNPNEFDDFLIKNRLYAVPDIRLCDWNGRRSNPNKEEITAEITEICLKSGEVKSVYVARVIDSSVDDFKNYDFEVKVEPLIKTEKGLVTKTRKVTKSRTGKVCN